MACFLVSAAEAAVVTVVEKMEEKKEVSQAEKENEVSEVTIPLSRKLKWLSYMLWGGALLLAFEHLWHGEIAPFFPFLTAMSNPADAAEMFTEMATAGVTMALLITLVWAGICIAANAIVKRAENNKAESRA